MNKVYTSANIGDLRSRFVDAVVDLINNTRAWDSGKQMYVETPEYIIRAKKEDNK